jgi:Domain of unknown function (DUF4386)
LHTPPKLGSAAAIVGAIFLVVGTILHPSGADPADSAAAFSEYAADRLWTTSHLTQFFGVVFMFLGLVALADTLRDEPTGWLARLGVHTAVAALAATAILQAVDGVALKAIVDVWANATADQKQSSYLAALAVRQIEIGTASSTAILFGAAVLLLAIAVIMSAKYPDWLGWLGVAGGIGTIAGGMLSAFTGFSAVEMNVAMPSNLMLVIWLGLMGAFMWRQT